MPFLDATNRTIDISPGYRILAPDLLGEIEQLPTGGAGDRSLPDEWEDRWGGLFADAEIKTEAAFVLVATDQRPARTGDQLRSDPTALTNRDGEEALLFTAQYTLPNHEYSILYRDEAGIYRWLFPQKPFSGHVRSGRELSFHLPRTGAPQPPTNDDATRGDWTAGGRRIIRLLRWPLREVISQGVSWAAEKWENQFRPYQFQKVVKGKIGGPVSWDNMRTGRALLLIHGAFSTASATFDGLIQHNNFEQIASLYENRIFAFDHPTMQRTPRENIQWLLDNLPPETSLHLDILAHSRGGLVTRTITEWLDELNHNGRTLTVDKAIFVGTPHQGTILADGENWYDFVDRCTNFITELPDHSYTIIAEAILTLVKLLAFGGLHGLPGIQTMLPKGEYLQKMNSTRAHHSTYYAVSADFSPADPNLLVRLRKQVQNFVTDRVFGDQPNDGVVPTVGCYQTANEAFGFPIPVERYRTFIGDAQVHHLNYFRNHAVVQQVIEWLL